MRSNYVVLGTLALAAVATLSGCGGDAASKPVIDPGDGGRYAPDIDPNRFVADIDNPYLPLKVGARWVLRGSDGEQVEIVVTPERRTVLGISAVVVRDTVTLDGALVEDTFDWYAQDIDGNVWYLGEETKEYEGGEVASTEGSWEAGVAGALPGIAMRAAPAAGDAYRQEFFAGEAEDMAQVLRIGDSTVVGGRQFQGVVVTREWTPLAPKAVEEKYYAPGVGFVLAVTVAGGSGREELVEFVSG